MFFVTRIVIFVCHQFFYVISWILRAGSCSLHTSSLFCLQSVYLRAPGLFLRVSICLFSRVNSFLRASSFLRACSYFESLQLFLSESSCFCMPPVVLFAYLQLFYLRISYCFYNLQFFVPCLLLIFTCLKLHFLHASSCFLRASFLREYNSFFARHQFSFLCAPVFCEPPIFFCAYIICAWHQ